MMRSVFEAARHRSNASLPSPVMAIILAAGACGLAIAVGGSVAGVVPGLSGSVRGQVATNALNLGADGLATPLCLANASAPAIRLWISQHPRSARGRLDHRRLLRNTRG